jgi:small subunit ribosomal protein S20
MANSLSARQRIEVNKRNQIRNKAYKSSMRTMYKKCLIAINNTDENNMESVNSLVSLSYSKLDKAVQKGMIHRNSAASKKSALAKAIKKREQNK